MGKIAVGMGGDIDVTFQFTMGFQFLDIILDNLVSIRVAQ